MKHTQITGSKSRKYGQSLVFALLASRSLLQAQDYLVSPDNTYKILQLANNSQSNGTPIVLGDRNTGTTALDGQTLWVYDAPTKTIRLAANPSKCILRAGQQMEGDALHLGYYVAGNPNQEWVFEDGRIKVAADKEYGIGLTNQNYNTGNQALLREVTALGEYQKWYREKKPQIMLAADGQWHRIESPGETYMNVAIPNPCPNPYLTIRIRGGDGGYRSVHNISTQKEDIKARGGQGATVTATFKIGTGANELRPGTNLRLVIGRAGESVPNDGNAIGCGGGGGTGVIYEAPGTRNNDFYYPWEMLLVAGGGGGAYADSGVKQRDGFPGEDSKFIDGEDPHGGEQDFGLGDGCGFRADEDNYSPGIAILNHEGAGFKVINGKVDPVGGKRIKQSNTWGGLGGYGFGAGGFYDHGYIPGWGEYLIEPGGGGGYSGAKTRYGGSSYIEWSKVTPGTGYMVKNITTSAPKNGYVEYQFSPNAPASRGYFEYGAQDIEILEISAYTLKWQSDGNLVLYGPPGAIWTSGTNGRGKDLAFQGDGNLAIYENGSVIWSTDTGNGHHDGKGGKTLTLNEEGMLSIADQDNKTIWRPTGPKSLRYNSFEYGLQDVELLKCGTYTLKWQGDGNLVLYGPSGAVWASYTNGHGNRISLQPDGNLVIYNNSTAVWTSDTADNQHGGNGGRQIMLTADGWLTILDKYWQTVGGWGVNAQP